MKAAGGAISVLVGTVLLRLTLTGTYTRYVKAGMGPWLVAAGLVVIVLGLTSLARSWRSRSLVTSTADSHEHGDAHGIDGRGHDHGEQEHGIDHNEGHDHGERVGWLLLAPIAALLLVAPPALGSYGVDRGARLDIRSGASGFDPLPDGDQPVPLTLLEFSQRAFDHDGTSLEGATVQLTGFVAGRSGDGGAGSGDGGFRLARYQIACCAADAAPVVVHVVGAQGEAPSRDQWVTVTGTFRSISGDVPQLAATSVVEVPEPDDPYE